MSFPTNIGVIVQARMGSTRLPKKSLMLLGKRPLLGHLLDSLLQTVPRNQLWIATSTNAEDDAIELFCGEEQVQCFRGHPTNVAQRFQQLLERYPCEYFARVNGDSPVFDFRVLEQGADKLKQNTPVDLVTTVVGRTFPSGANLEILRTTTYLDAYPQFSTNDHFEHVTKFFYEHLEDYALAPLMFISDQRPLPKMSVDDTEDFSKMQRFFEGISKPHFEYSLLEKCSLMG